MGKHMEVGGCVDENIPSESCEGRRRDINTAACRAVEASRGGSIARETCLDQDEVVRIARTKATIEGDPSLVKSGLLGFIASSRKKFKQGGFFVSRLDSTRGNHALLGAGSMLTTGAAPETPDRGCPNTLFDVVTTPPAKARWRRAAEESFARGSSPVLPTGSVESVATTEQPLSLAERSSQQTSGKAVLNPVLSMMLANRTAGTCNDVVDEHDSVVHLGPSVERESVPAREVDDVNAGDAHSPLGPRKLSQGHEFVPEHGLEQGNVEDARLPGVHVDLRSDSVPAVADRCFVEQNPGQSIAEEAAEDLDSSPEDPSAWGASSKQRPRMQKMIRRINAEDAPDSALEDHDISPEGAPLHGASSNQIPRMQKMIRRTNAEDASASDCAAVTDNSDYEAGSDSDDANESFSDDGSGSFSEDLDSEDQTGLEHSSAATQKRPKPVSKVTAIRNTRSSGHSSGIRKREDPGKYVAKQVAGRTHQPKADAHFSIGHTVTKKAPEMIGARAVAKTSSTEISKERRRMAAQLLKPFGRKRPTWQKALPKPRPGKDTFFRAGNRGRSKKAAAVVPDEEGPFTAISQHLAKKRRAASSTKTSVPTSGFSRKIRSGLLKRRRLTAEQSDSDSLDGQAVLDSVPSPELLQLCRSMDARIVAGDE